MLTVTNIEGHCTKWFRETAAMLTDKLIYIYNIIMVTMVLILDGNSEIGARVRSNLFDLTCFKHL